MIVDFANFDMKERPLLILKNANNAPIGVLGYAYDISVDLRYNETSTIEFELPAFVDGAEVPYYNDVVGMRIVELRGVGQFTLINPKESGDGVSKSKTCKGYSLEYEFAYKKLTLAEGTYNFYDLTDNSNTLMGIILEKMPSWSIGSVDEGLVGRYRTYEVSNENLYNFIKGTVQESYRCIFEFDTMQRMIYVRDVSQDAESTPIFISTGNLATQIEIEENTENIVTRLDVNGAEGVDIRDVNPCGTNKIIDLSYFMTPSNFSQALIDKYFAWKDIVESNRQVYYSGSIEYSALIMQKTTEEAKLTDLKEELSSLENTQAVTIQAIAQGLQNQSALDQINASIAAKKSEISAKENEISDISSDLASAMTQLKTIQETCSFEKYFSADELGQMDKYIKDDEISESSFAVVEKDTYAEDGSGTELSGTGISISGASITGVINTGDKDIYDISGGTLSVGDVLSAAIISAVVEIKSGGSFIATAYLSHGSYSGNTFDNACISITGNAVNVTNDLAANDAELMSGTSLSFTASDGYQYFTFDVNEYQKRSVAWDLFKYGEEVLAKLAQPGYTFDITSANFFTGEDFDVFRRKIRLGKKIYTELAEGQVLQPICIAIKLEYENPESLDLQFSDSYVSGDSTFQLVDLLNQSVSLGKSLDMSKYVYSSFEDSGASTSIREFMTSALDVAKNAIITSGEQAISWDASGLRLRRYANTAHTEFEPEQIWMINNSIVMTADNWTTAQMAIGKFHDENLGDCWGIVAPRIVGTLLAGSELIIESVKKEGGVSVFRVDGDGVRLHNGDLSVTGSNRHIAINPSLGIVIGKYPVYSKDSSGNYTLNETNANFWADTDGNLHYKGTLHAASGDFTGAVRATSLMIVGSDSDESISDYIAGHDSVTSAANAAQNAQSTANTANSNAVEAMNKADTADSNASSALAAANSASTEATNARALADSIYDGTKGIYFTNSSIGTVQIDTSVGIKVIGTDNSYFSAKNNAMGFFKSDGTSMLYYEDGNMVLRGILAAAGSYIGGTGGWVVGTNCMYNNGASSLGAAGGIYMGTGGISVGSAIVMKPDGTFIIRGDNTSTESNNYVLKIEPVSTSEGITYQMRIGASVIFDESFVLSVENGGTGGADRTAFGILTGLFRVTSTSEMDSISDAINGDLCVLYSEGDSGATMSGAMTTSTTTSPGYLAIGSYSASAHKTKYFGISDPTYWNIANLSSESVSSAYGRCGVGQTVSGACGLYVPVQITVNNSAVGISSFTLNFTLNTRPSGCSRDLISEWTSGMKVRLYKPGSGGSYTLIASTTYTLPASYKNTTNADRSATVSFACSEAVTTGEYYVVFYTKSTESLFWIKPASLSIPETSVGAAAGLYLKTGGMWRALSQAT